MQEQQQRLAQMVQGKKVAFIGAGVSHRTLIEKFVGLGAQVTLCDRKDSLEQFGPYGETLRRLGVRLSLGEHYMDSFAGQDMTCARRALNITKSLAGCHCRWDPGDQ